MAVLVGRQGFLNVGAETTWGTTAGSFPVYSRVNSIAISKSVTRVRKTNLSTSAANFQQTHFDSTSEVGGSVVLPLLYEGSGIFLKAALGDVSSTAGPAPFTHTYEPDLDPPSLTIKANRGSGSAAVEEFTGMKISSMSISGAAGEEVLATFEFIGKDASTRAGTSAPTYGDGKGIFHHELTASGLSYNSNNYQIRSFELTVNNNIERRFNLGSKLSAEPQYSDMREVTLSVTADLEDNNLYNSQISGDASDVVLAFENSDNDEFKITLKNAYLSEYNDDVTSPGVIERTFTFVGEADSSNKALKIEIVNQDSDPIGN